MSGKTTVQRGFIVAGVCLLVATAPAVAAPAWLAPVNLSDVAQAASDPQVAVDPQGNAVAVWTRFNGTHNIVQGAVRPAGGTWQAAVDLSAAGQTASSPQVAIDQQGAATAVWQRFNGSDLIVQSAALPAGGAWSAPVDLSVAGQSASSAQVAVNPQGAAVAVWGRSNGTDIITQAAVRPVGGAWSAPADLSVTTHSAVDAQVAVDPLGNAVAVWERFNGTKDVVQGAVRPAGGVWAAPVNLSNVTQQAIDPQVGLDPQGNATAVWTRTNGTKFIVQSAVRPVGGAWQAAVDVSAALQDAFSPQIAVDPQGNATAVWGRSNGTNFIVQSAARPVGGAWGGAADLSAPGRDASAAQVVLGPQGNAVAVWIRTNGTNPIVRGAVRPVGGAWSAPADLSAAGQTAYVPQVAVDPLGNATAVWHRFDGTNNIVQGAGYDASAPELRSLVVPTSGVAGQPVSMSVAPFDVWSLGATSWTFGDSAAATGTAVTHTYPSAGTFTVGVTAADTVANSTSASRTITIAPAPVPTPLPTPTPPPAPTAAVGALRLSASTFRAVRTTPKPKAAAVRTGTRVSYTLNVAASVRFTVERSTRGRSVGGRCVKRTSSNRRRKGCTRFVPVQGGFARVRLAGADHFRFTGRVGGHGLTPARYRLVATPTGGTVTGKPTRALFRIVR